MPRRYISRLLAVGLSVGCLLLVAPARGQEDYSPLGRLRSALQAALAADGPPAYMRRDNVRLACREALAKDPRSLPMLREALKKPDPEDIVVLGIQFAVEEVKPTDSLLRWLEDCVRDMAIPLSTRGQFAWRLGRLLCAQGANVRWWRKLLVAEALSADLRALLWDGGVSETQLSAEFVDLAIQTFESAPPALADQIVLTLSPWLTRDPSGGVAKYLYRAVLPPEGGGCRPAPMVLVNLWFLGDEHQRARALTRARSEAEVWERTRFLELAACQVLACHIDEERRMALAEELMEELARASTDPPESAAMIRALLDEILAEPGARDAMERMVLEQTIRPW